MLCYWQLDSCRDSEVNYKSADRTERDHKKTDALCWELGTKKEERRGEILLPHHFRIRFQFVLMNSVNYTTAYDFTRKLKVHLKIRKCLYQYKAYTLFSIATLLLRKQLINFISDCK